MSTVKITQADWDRVWLELAELRQSLNAIPIRPRLWGNTRAPGAIWVGDTPPTPDQVADAIAPTPDYRSDLPAEESCSCEESERLKAELGEAHVRAQELESERDVSRQHGATLRRMLSQQEHESRRLERQLAAANALLRRCTPWTDELRAAIQAHLSGQPAAPSRPDAEQRVLDAVSAAVAAWQKGPAFDAADVIAAELARRGHG